MPIIHAATTIAANTKNKIRYDTKYPKNAVKFAISIPPFLPSFYTSRTIITNRPPKSNSLQPFVQDKRMREKSFLYTRAFPAGAARHKFLCVRLCRKDSNFLIVRSQSAVPGHGGPGKAARARMARPVRLRRKSPCSMHGRLENAVFSVRSTNGNLCRAAPGKTDSQCSQNIPYHVFQQAAAVRCGCGKFVAPFVLRMSVMPLHPNKGDSVRLFRCQQTLPQVNIFDRSR